MLVYGDPKFSTTTGDVVAVLEKMLFNSAERDLDFWRTFLIRAGQLEQGLADLADRPGAKAFAERAEQVTNWGAAAFYDAWRYEGRSAQTKFLPAIEAALGPLKSANDLEVTIKIPEGYEFYALFTEQYILSSQRWAADRAGEKVKTVLVIGLRSIGTSLSAVVAESLRNQGWDTRRITVRPSGHPFERELILQGQPAEAFAVLVDEGPGLSGSSMAAAGEALETCGFSRERVAAFPGHGNEPGAAASPKVKEWWRIVPRYFTNIDKLRWAGVSLREHLVERTRRYIEGAGDINLQEITGGEWRRFVFDSQEDWCASCGPFERAKYRCAARSGHAVLWKFAGLGSLTNETLSDLDASRSRSKQDWPLKEGMTLPVLERWGGFACVPWIQGRAMKAQDASASVLEMLAGYLMSSARPAASYEESCQRLSEMLLCNLGEAFGERLAKPAQGVIERFKTGSVSEWPAYSDGRMSPHEWVRDGKGRIYKTDSEGNVVDHTLVGEQPLLWDIAGAIVEWELTPSQSQMFLNHFLNAGLAVHESALRFYLAAYAAFKMGQAGLCARMSEGEARAKLEDAEAFYRARATCAMMGPSDMRASS